MTDEYERRMELEEHRDEIFMRRITALTAQLDVLEYFTKHLLAAAFEKDPSIGDTFMREALELVKDAHRNAVATGDADMERFQSRRIQVIERMRSDVAHLLSR